MAPPIIVEQSRMMAPPIVVEQPRMMAPPIVVEQPRMMAPPIGIVGRLKLHLKEANLKHNDGNFLNKMSPFVILRINGTEERRSAVVEHGGKHPHWTLQFFEWELFNLDHELYIEVLDRQMMVGTEFIG